MSHGSDKKSREQLLAEIEALRQQLAAREAQGDKHSPGDSSSPSLSRPITRREALTQWVAPVILSVPIVAALHSETARGQVPPTAPPTPSPPSPSPPTGAPTLAPTLAPTPSPPSPSPPTGAPTLAPAPTRGSVAVPGLGLAGIAVLGGALAAAGAKLLKDRDATSEKPDPEGDGGAE